MKPVIMRMVVDLPAPLGPRKPSTSPFSTVNEMPSTARFGPKAFTRLSMRIIGRQLRAATAEFQGCGLKIEARFSHKPKDQTYVDVKDIPGRAAAHFGSAAGAGAELSGEAGSHRRTVRAGRWLRLHRALHRAAAHRLARQTGHRREQAGRGRRARRRAGR